MTARNIEDIYPLSPLQRGMLFHCLYEPARALYYQSFSSRISCALDTSAFRRAWALTVDRHTALRTAFLWAAREEPLQVVFRAVELPWRLGDWRGSSSDEQSARLSLLLEQDQREGFDLARPPLMRFHLIRIGDEEYRFVWSSHHLLFDGWSVPLVFDDVAELYRALTHGHEPQRPAARSYGDYIAWLRARDHASAERFWRARLDGFTEPTELPCRAKVHDRPDLGALGEHVMRLTVPATAEIQEFARRHHLALSTIIQAAWALLLSRHGSKRDVLYGWTVFGRPADLDGSDAMVGMFINTVPMRVDVPPEASVLTWLGEIQRLELETRAHEDTPLVDIQGWSEVPRPRRLFDSLLVLTNAIGHPPEQIEGLGMTDMRTVQRTSYPVVLRSEPAEGLAVAIDYDRRLFDEEAIRDMVDQLTALLREIVRDPERRVRDIPLVGAPHGQGEPLDVPIQLGRPLDRHAHVTPRTPLEGLIASIWADVLGIDRVGIHDNFFELGGHSLLAMKIVTRLRKALPREVSIPRLFAALFESPTIAGLVHSMDEVDEAIEPGREPPPIRRVSRDEDQPLSFAQERLWFLTQLTPETANYSVPVVHRIVGPLDRDALVRALALLVSRHELLRTVFPQVNGRPVQRIQPFAAPSVSVVELQGEEDAERRAREVIRFEVHRPFDLRNGPLFRPHLLSVTPGDTYLILNFHHIIIDGWSLEILLRELGATYAAFARAEEAPLAEPELQYIDYAIWQRSWLEGEALERPLAYWREKLSGAPQRLALPTDRPHPPVTTFHGSVVTRRLDGALVDSLERLSRQEDATLFVTLLAAFKVLLSRYSGQSDILVGAPVATRRWLGAEGVIGPFMNTFVLRSDLSADPEFIDFLAQVRRTVLEAHLHEDVPFEKLVQELRLGADLSQSPLFQVVFTFQHAGGDELALTGTRTEPVRVEYGTSKFDLTLAVVRDDDGAVCELEYNTDLFDVETIHAALGHYSALLSAIAARPNTRVSALELMEEDERRAVVRGFNDTDSPFEEVCIHHLIERRAAEIPDAIALVFDKTSLSYREVNERANQLAHYLLARGVGPERRIGVYMRRTPEIVVTLLAVLKAGGAYVPMDPDYPHDRVAYTLADAGTAAVVSQSSLLERLQQPAERVICVDRDRAEIARQPRTNPVSGVGPENLAYVIYTSGSTGRPKGVAIEHRSTVAMLDWAAKAFAADEMRGVLASTSICFDIAVFEIFAPLSVGATVILAENVLQLSTMPAARDVTLLNTVPSAMAALLETDIVLPALRTVNLAGEPLKRALVTASYGLPGVERVLNLYGPTEDTTYSTVLVVERDSDRPPTVGSSLLNKRAYILDPAGAPVPRGVRGEVFVAGAGVTRGYLGRPALTAERYVPDTLSGVPGARMYRTGDIARWLRNGTIEFLGRVDHQVKIRGFRIELAEIENVLRLHPAVSEAVVLVDDDSRVGKRLVAFIEPKSGAQLSRSGVREHVAGKLPGYMMPAAFVVVPAFPLTPNGKIDRKVLPNLLAQTSGRQAPAGPSGASDRARPAVSASARSGETRRVAALPELEDKIAAIWKELLHLDRVGADESFFDLGGHSLLLEELQFQLAERLGLEVPLLDFFRYPTVRTLAEAFARGSPATPALAARAQAGQTGPTQSAPEAAQPRAASPAQPRAVSPAQSVPASRAPEPPPECAPPATRRGSDGLSRPAGLSDRCDVAIIGMSGRFPGASDLDELWVNLRDGVESIRFFRDEELAGNVPAALLVAPNYVKAAAILEDVDLFDADFFGLTPREAQIMDPQHRIFLEQAWNVLESAGYDSTRYPGPIGVFAGCGASMYALNLVGHPELVESTAGFATTILTEGFSLPTRASYALDLKGPSVFVSTACSTSLVAIHLACQSLRTGESEMALAGGVSVTPIKIGYPYEEGGYLSPDGHCRAFDAKARGTVGGSGAGVVLLKRLQDAIRDGDTIRAVIRGSAINNDGSQKIGFTAPSIAGQAAVIRQALAAADVHAETIAYVETHGTGTKVGDPIEVAGLTQAFRAHTDKTGFCAIGSVKTNFGHTDSAAGVAGVIKTVLAMENGQIPPSLNFEEPNQAIDFASTPFHVCARLTDWPTSQAVRRAGVTALGIGGTNAHVILEEAQQEESGPSRRDQHLLVLSARTGTALDRATEQLADHLGRSEQPLADVAYTLQVGRRAFEHRRFVVCRDREDAVRSLRTGEVRRGTGTVSARPEVVFLFPGSATEYVGMGRALYAAEPRFRAEMDECARILEPIVRLDVLTALHPAAAEVGRARQAFQRLALALPALFSVEYATARLLESLGVRPQCMLGHGLGEHVAACLAGVMSLRDALALIALRGQLLDRAARPSVIPAAGPTASLDPSLAVYHDAVSRIELRAPSVAYLSNVTGTWVSVEQATNPAYWTEQLRSTMRFADGMNALLGERERIFVEVGSGQTVTIQARGCAHARAADLATVTTIPDQQRPSSDEAGILAALGELWIRGVEIDWNRLWAGEARRRVRLPTYPFERDRHWVEFRIEHAAGPVETVATPPPERPRTRTPIAPTGGAEAALCAIWQEHLGLPRVAPDENFFDLGGTSLLGIQIVAAARRDGWHFTSKQLFELQTISALAAVATPAGSPPGGEERAPAGEPTRGAQVPRRRHQPSDFPRARLTQAELDDIVASIGDAQEEAVADV